MSDTHELKITTPVVLEQALKDNTEYQFTGIFTTKGFKADPDGAGNYKYTHKAALTGQFSLIASDRTMVQGKAKESSSKKLRGALWHLQQEKECLDVPEEVFYEQWMKIIISNLPEIYDRYRRN
jgi:hypothetical protein